VRETLGMLRRTLARLDVSSRTLIALIEPGSCFAGTLLELALAADRTIWPISLEHAPSIAVSDLNLGALPRIDARSRLVEPLLRRSAAIAAISRVKGQPVTRSRRVISPDYRRVG